MGILLRFERKSSLTLSFLLDRVISVWRCSQMNIELGGDEKWVIRIGLKLKAFSSTNWEQIQLVSCWLGPAVVWWILAHVIGSVGLLSNYLSAEIRQLSITGRTRWVINWELQMGPLINFHMSWLPDYLRHV